MRTLGVAVISGVLVMASAIGVAALDASDPTTTDELLSGMVIEEVEPGVLRIVNDGYRDLWHRDNKGLEDGQSDAVSVGATGAVWRITPDHRLFRLGGEAEWTYHLRNGVGEIPARQRRGVPR